MFETTFHYTKPEGVFLMLFIEEAIKAAGRHAEEAKVLAKRVPATQEQCNKELNEFVDTAEFLIELQDNIRKNIAPEYGSTLDFLKDVFKGGKSK